MKIIVDSDVLLKRLKVAQKLLNPSAIVAITDDFLFEVGSTLRVTATDLENTIVSEIDAVIDGLGRFVIPSKVLVDLLSVCSKESITIDIEDHATISTSTGEYVVPIVHGDEFPTPPVVVGQSLDMSSADILEGINATLYAAGGDEFRPIFGGICFTLQSGSVLMAATDMYRVSETKTLSPSDVEGEFVLPRKGAQVLSMLLGKKSDSVNIVYDSKNVKFSYNGTDVVCRRIEGKYPNYRGVIPNDVPIECVVSAEELLPAVKRVSVFASKDKTMITLKFSPASILVSTKDVDRKVSGDESVNCECTGEAVITFKPSFLIDSLSRMNGKLNIGIVDEKSGVRFKDEHQTTTTVIIPMVI